MADIADASVSSVTDAAQALVRRAQELVLPAAVMSWLFSVTPRGSQNLQGTNDKPDKL